MEIDSGEDVTAYITNLFHELGVEDPSMLTVDEKLDVFVAATAAFPSSMSRPSVSLGSSKG